jgi:hypothetical protein
MDVNDIRMGPRYIRSAVNIWANRLSGELGHDDWPSPSCRPPYKYANT